jgi:FMN phosphatase YigB (HAD superfamily)
MPRVIVFDLMGTLLDLRAIDPHFERFLEMHL